MKLVIEHRRLITVNSDPQRRCYNGCHYSTETFWSAWEELQDTTPDKAKDRLAFWTDLNDYAVSQRGESARQEFRIKEVA